MKKHSWPVVALAGTPLPARAHGITEPVIFILLGAAPAIVVLLLLAVIVILMGFGRRDVLAMIAVYLATAATIAVTIFAVDKDVGYMLSPLTAVLPVFAVLIHRRMRRRPDQWE